MPIYYEKVFCEKCGGHLVWKYLKPEPTNFMITAIASLDNLEDYAQSWHGGVESQML